MLCASIFSRMCLCALSSPILIIPFLACCWLQHVLKSKFVKFYTLLIPQHVSPRQGLNNPTQTSRCISVIRLVQTTSSSSCFPFTVPDGVPPIQYYPLMLFACVLYPGCPGTYLPMSLTVGASTWLVSCFLAFFPPCSCMVCCVPLCRRVTSLALWSLPWLSSPYLGMIMKLI